MMRWGAAALVLALLASSTQTAAQEIDAGENELRRLMDEGVVLRREGRDQEAAEVFRRAHDAGAGAAALAQLALAEQALGRWLDAAEHLEAAMLEEDNEWIARHRAALESSQRTILAHLGTLEIEGEPAGARVTIDGRDVGTLPLAAPIRVEAGSVVVGAELADHYPVQRVVAVLAGRRARLVLSFVPLPAEPTVAEPVARVEPIAVDAPVAPGAARDGDLDVLAWSIGTSALAVLSFVASAIAWWGFREPAVEAWNACSAVGPDGRWSNCPGHGARYQRAEVATVLLGGLAGVSAIAGVALFVQLAIEPGAERTAVGITLRGSM
jgi:hypothetical protein